MNLFAQIIKPNFNLGIAKITDSSKKELKKIQSREVRKLFAHLIGIEDIAINKTNNKPFLAHQAPHISLSHSQQWITAAFSSYPIGIDIQIFTPKLQIVQDKILHQKEQAYKNNITALGIIWTLKEAAYKCLTQPPLYFHKNYCIESNLQLTNTHLQEIFLSITTPNNSYTLKAYYQIFETFVIGITINIENYLS